MRRLLTIPFILAFSLLAAPALAADSHAHHTPMHAGEVTPGHSLFHLSSEWTTQEGRSFRLSELRGRPTVITMIYGSCNTACPVLVNDARRVDRAARKRGKDLQVVVVSFDPLRDTPERLSEYADNHGANSNDWRFLHGSAGDIRTLAALLGVRYRDNGDGSFDHSNLVTLLDAEGRIAGRIEGLAQPVDPIVDALERLPTDGRH